MDSLIDVIEELPGYDHALKVVQMNSDGPIYLVGNVVSCTLANVIHGEPQIITRPFSFLLERRAPQFGVPRDWTQTRNEGLLKLAERFEPFMRETICRSEEKYLRFKTRKGYEVNMILLSDHHYIIAQGKPATIANFFEHAPLTIDCIALEIHDSGNAKTRKLWGQTGVNAILERTCSINNFSSAHYQSALRNMSLQDYAKGRAEHIKFQLT